MQTVGTSSNDLATKTTDNNSQSGDSGDDETNGMMTQETRTTPRRYSTPYRCERRGVLLIWAILDGVHLMSASLVSQAILNCIRKKWGEPSAQVKMLENNANASLTARRHQLLLFFFWLTFKMPAVNASIGSNRTCLSNHRPGLYSWSTLYKRYTDEMNWFSTFIS